MKVRSSLVLSVGDDLNRLACHVQDAVERRLPRLAPVVAFVNIRPDGTVVRRQDGESRVVGKFDGLADAGDMGAQAADDASGPSSAYARNYAALADKQGDLLSTLRPIVAEVRSQQNLVRLQRDHGMEDSGGLFVYVLADSFGPLGSVLPLALLTALRERPGHLGSGFELSLSVLYFLPGLFLASDADEERAAMARALARSHATFSEIEGDLYTGGPSRRRVPCRVWVAGSVDRQGAVAEFASIEKPTAYFLTRLIDGSLGDDRRWDNELGHVVGQRRSFLSSFGFADLYFPRAYLTEFALASARRRLHRRLSHGGEPDAETLSAEVQGWIGEARIDGVLDRLKSPTEGKLALRAAPPASGALASGPRVRGSIPGASVPGASVPDASGPRAQLDHPGRAVVLQEPEQPLVEPNKLVANEYAQAVATKVEADPRWGALVRKAGDRLFDACLKEFRDALAQRLDDPKGGLAAGRVFCDHVAGTGRGLTSALVGADVRNLDSLAFDVQCRLAQEAGMPGAGDAERLKRLKVLEIPGKEEAISNAHGEIEAARKTLKQISAPGTAAPVAAQQKTRRKSKKEPPEEPPEDGRIAEVQNRIAALEGDVEEYQRELAILRDECAREEHNVSEQRRMARDPSRRHLLLARMSEAEAVDRDLDQLKLKMATDHCRSANEKYRGASAALQEALRDIGLYAGGSGVLFLGVYALMSLTDSVDFTFDVAWKVFLAGAVLWLVVRGGTVWRLWRAERKAWRERVAAREAVANMARRLWNRQIRGLRRRFAFLVHAEAIRVLDRLRDEVMAERARIEELEKRVQAYGESVEKNAAAMAEIAPDREPDYHRQSVLTTRQAETLVDSSKALDSELRDAVDAVARSAVVQEAREDGSATDLGPSVNDAEAAFLHAVEKLLDGEDAATVLDRWLADEKPEDVRKLWRGVQHAARAQLGLHPDGSQGVVRNLFLVPRKSSKALRAHLDQNVVADGRPKWSTTGRDYVGVCKTVTAFPTYQVAELTMAKSDLDAHWKHVCARSGVPPFSLPAHEALAHVEDEDALVVLQAAIAYLNAEGGRKVGRIRRLIASRGSAPQGPRTPKEWLAEFENAEELPSETVEELAEQLRARTQSGGDDADRLRRFKDQVPERQRLMLEFLMERRH